MTANKNRGFTLLEIMVVVAIIGAVLSMAMLAIGPSEGRALEKETKRIYALMELAKEEAILNTQEMALVITGEGYYFQILTEEGWLAIEGDKTFKERTLPEQVRLELAIMGEEVELAAGNQSGDGAGEKAATLNRLFFLSSGEMTPFEMFLHYESEEDGQVIVGNEVGDLELKDQKVTL